MRLTAREIADQTGGVLSGEPNAVASSYTIDTRLLDPGACFVALRAHRDGHDFVPDAWRRGAAVVLVEHPVTTPGGRASVELSDPLAGLGALGRHARSRLSRAVVVGITGSAGKTSTKDLLAAALAPTRAVHASPASYNNEAGVPITLLSAPDDVEVVVAEMGARFAGNISELCATARPHVGVITNIGLAHIGLLGGRPGVARVKGELLEALPADGLAVLDADDEYTPALRARTAAPVLTVALGDTPGADVRAYAVSVDAELRASFRLETPWGSARVRLRTRGEHQVLNAAMASAVAGHLGVPVEQVADGLGRATGAEWRMQLSRSSGGVAVLNDAYNASPTSTGAALQALGRMRATGRRVAVLGEMMELGEASEREHAEIGRLAVECGATVVVVVGEGAHAIATGARHAAAAAGVDAAVIEVPDAEAANTAVLGEVRSGDAVLVKASRAVGLERLAEALIEASANA